MSELALDLIALCRHEICECERLADRVEVVLKLHQAYVLEGHEDMGWFCAHCSAETRAPWPCPTVRALNGERDRQLSKLRGQVPSNTEIIL